MTSLRKTLLRLLISIFAYIFYTDKVILHVQFFILFFSCSDLISQFRDLLTLATDPMVKL